MPTIAWTARRLREALDLPTEQRHEFLKRHLHELPLVRSTVLDLLAEIETEAGALPSAGALEGPLAERLAAELDPGAEAPLPGPGEKIGTVRLEDLLGVGGMGAVFVGFDEKLERAVAVKALLTDLRLHPNAQRRFRREAKLLSQLNHPGICQIYDLVEAPGAEYLVLELIEGENLREVAPTLAPEQRLRVVIEIAEALTFAHERGIVHRDLKPENVMVAAERRVKVLDFGIARLESRADGESEIGESGGEPVDGLTGWGALLGTAAYMSPEQARGEEATSASDVFSLGLLLHELVSECPPHPRGLSASKIVLRAAQGLVDPPRDVAPELARLLSEMEHPNPDRRPTARRVAEELAAILEAPRRRRRKRIRRLALAAVGLALAVAAAVTLESRWEARLAQRLGQKVERLESTLWKARSIELHDMRPLDTLIRSRLSSLEDEVEGLGFVASGPGHYALGRGYLALYDFGSALRHLERAWEEGFREPTVAYALGVALGHSYQAALAEAERVGIAEERERRTRRAELDFRDPALRYLRMSRAEELESPIYVEALIDSFEGRYEEGLAKAREAFERTPWLYEAKILESQILHRMGQQEEYAGEYETSMDLFRRAERAAREAAEIGSSDPQTHARACTSLASLLRAQVWRLGEGDRSIFEEALAACRRSLVADPDQPSVHSQVSRVYQSWAELLVLRGEDPDEAVEPAMTAAHEALRLEPEEPLHLTALAGALLSRGKFLGDTGGDPRPVFREALRYCHRALELDPRGVDVLNTTALLYLDIGYMDNSLGEDPRAALQEALPLFGRAAELLPERAAYPINRGIAYWIWMDYLVHRLGQDPSELAAQALAELDRALEINPRSAFGFRTVGSVHVALAEWNEQQGLDPDEPASQALAALEKAREIRGSDLNIYWLIARAEACRLRFAVRSSRPPDDYLDSLRDVVRSALELDASATFLTDLLREAEQLTEEAGKAGGSS